MKSKILALKYRPQEFEDLIGQEIMVKAIVNGISLKKTPNAYLLTGIRGVGKTTTARLIAKGLNCEKNNDRNLKCSKVKFCSTCEDIINSNHIDILEMDAASKTGIDDIRELIENSKYSPTSADYKIFIIDEVHMLSKQAFNGLLKTLEEPPPRLKFILATTEVRKIPVTILSRCQRYDLKRVEFEKLYKHLKNIVEVEKGRISDDAIRLIVKTSEGSVRDSISLLDRALISQNTDENKVIEQNDVRQMLGLADKLKILSLFKEVLSGNEQVALNCFKELLNDGIDAKNFLNDFLEVIYLFSRRISLGPIDKDMSISETEAQMIEDYSKNLDMQDLGLFWQLTVKTIDDLRLVGNENLTLEMYIMQLIYLKNLENKNLTTNKSDDALIVKQTTNDKKIEKSYADKDIKNKISEQLKSTDQLKANPIKKVSTEKQKTKIEINSLQDLINVSNDEKEIQLKYDLERNVKLVSFNKGKIDISFNEKLNKNFIKILSEKLLNWTGERWIISLSKNSDAKSIYEKSLEEKNNKIEEFKNSRVAREIEKSFPDAILTDLKQD